jgi:hypothetical protein
MTPVAKGVQRSLVDDTHSSGGASVDQRMTPVAQGVSP